MKLIVATCLAIACAASLSAQSTTTETTRSKTKVKVDGGKDVTVTGCLEENPGGGYMLSDRSGGMKYALVGGDNLSKHLGHRIEVKGKATDRGDGKVKIDTKQKTGNADTTHERTQVKGDVHALGVKSIKMLSSSCG
jgi:Protein of unknown function (DUF5818)